jgi:hypothetical protein
MSRGLGEVQIQALRGFLWKQQIDEDWLSLRVIKRRAWGDRSNVPMYPNFNLRQVRQSSDEYKTNHHSSFKRALELLVARGLLEERCICRDNALNRGISLLAAHVPANVCIDHVKLPFSREWQYRLTEGGKCALSKFHTYKNGAAYDQGGVAVANLALNPSNRCLSTNRVAMRWHS